MVNKRKVKMPCPFSIIFGDEVYTVLCGIPALNILSNEIEKMKLTRINCRQ